MKKLLLITMILTAMFSCSKDEDLIVLDRDQFIGEFSGTMTTVYNIDGEEFSRETKVIIQDITEGTEENKIILEGNSSSEDLIGSVVGNVFSLDANQYQYVDMDNGSSIKLTITGKGIISANGSISMEQTTTGQYNDKYLLIKSTGTLNKN